MHSFENRRVSISEFSSCVTSEDGCGRAVPHIQNDSYGDFQHSKQCKYKEKYLSKFSNVHKRKQTSLLAKVRWPKSVTAISTSPRQFQFDHGNFNFTHGNFNLTTAISTSLTAISIWSRQFQLHSRQFQFDHGNFNFAHGNFNLVTAISTSLTAISI